MSRRNPRKSNTKPKKSVSKTSKSDKEEGNGDVIMLIETNCDTPGGYNHPAPLTKDEIIEVLKDVDTSVIKLMKVDPLRGWLDNDEMYDPDIRCLFKNKHYILVARRVEMPYQLFYALQEEHASCMEELDLRFNAPPGRTMDEFKGALDADDPGFAKLRAMLVDDGNDSDSE